MFDKMRRQDKKMSTIRAKEILKSAEYGILSTVGANGYPYGIPLNYVYENNSIYFHSANTGAKLNNIKKINNKVSFCVVPWEKAVAEKFTTEYESVIFFGKAFFVEGKEKNRALELLVEKFSPEYSEKGKNMIDKEFDDTTIIRIDIDHITGKESKI